MRPASQMAAEKVALNDLFKLVLLDESVCLRPHWKELGSQLGVSDNDIETIAYDLRNEPDQSTACIREVLKYRQKMDLPLTKKTLNDAIQEVKSRIEADKRLKQHKLGIEKEQSDIIAAIKKLKTSMDELDERNEEIAENVVDLKKQLKDEKESLSPSKIQWQREDEEWKRGVERRQQLRTAINEGNFKQSQFVNDFLQSKLMRENLSDVEIEGYLRQTLIIEEKKRSQQLRTRYHKVRLHHKHLKHLLNKIHGLKHLIDGRLHEAYEKILKSLKDVGLKDDKIKDLQDKLKCLNQTLAECEQGLKECDVEITNGICKLREFKNELKSFLNPFSEVVEGMHGITTTLEYKEQDLQSYLKEKQSEYDRYKEKIKAGMVVGGVTGLFTGAALGSQVFPVVGTVIGAGVGYALAKTETFILDRKKKELEEVEVKLAAKRRILRTFKSAENGGNTEIKELKKLIHEVAIITTGDYSNA